MPIHLVNELTRILGNFPKSIPGNPVDWLVHMAEVDNIYNTFPYGEQSVGAMNPYQVLPRSSEHNEITFISSNSYTKYIDVFGTLFGLLWNGITEAITEIAAYFGWESLKGAASPDGDLHVEPDRDAVYVVRAFSGMLQSGVNPGEFDLAWGLEDGKQNFWIIFGFNTAMAAIDASSVWIDVKTATGGEGGFKLRKIVKVGVRKGIRLATKRVPKGASGFSSGELGKTVLSIINSVANDISCVVAGDVSSALLENSTKKIAKFLGKSIDPLYKISVGSAAVERTMALIGHKLSKVTPLETWVLVVGKPFTPVVETVEPEKGPQGEMVTLTGKNFDHRNKDYNKIRLGKYWLDAKEAKVLSVNSDGTVLKFKVADDQPHGDMKILIRTPYSGGTIETPKSFHVKRIPRLLSITPDSGFAPVSSTADSPFAGGYNGTEVTLTGRGFCPPQNAPDDKVYFGQVLQKSINVDTCTKIRARVPEMSPGTTGLFIQSPQWDTETQRMSFSVLDSPVLSSISPTEAMIGQYMEVNGSGFGSNLNEVKIKVEDSYDAKILSVENTKISFQMPSVGEPGDELEVTVWTPAGQSSAKTITRLEGATVPPLDELPDGYYIDVNATSTTNNGPDGKLTLDDAAAFARGDENPFSPPWDDRNEKYTTHYTQQKVYDEENDRWTYPWKEGETVGPEYSSATYDHEYRRHYRVDHYHSDHGGGVTEPYLTSTVDLDETEEQMEEGDYLKYSAQGGKDFKDTIDVKPETCNARNLELGEQDRLKMSGSTLNLGETGIVLNKNGCKLELGTVISNATTSIITITGNRNSIKATLTDGENNFITIDGGLGNYLEEVNGENCGGHGVEIKNGHKNSITGTFQNCGGHGVFIKDGEENEVSGTTVKHCSGNGIYIDGGRNNSVRGTVEHCEYGVEVNNSFGTTVYGISYKECRKSGVYIHDSEKLQLLDLVCQGNQGHGVELANTKLNSIDDLTCKKNAGDGIHLNDGCLYNTFQYVDVVGNENGIALEGVTTSFNEFEDCAIGRIHNNEFLGNRKNGIYISGGAHDNTFGDDESDGSYIEIYGSGQHGVFIEGTGTKRNILEDSSIGIVWGSSKYYVGNKGDGVRISGGATENVVYDCDIGNNDGNGVTIDGENSDGNEIDSCHIGDSGEADDEPPPRPNKGWGVLISNGPKGTGVYSTVHNNLDGGIKLVNITKEWGEDEERQKLATIEAGIGYWDSSDDASSGNGIHLERSTDVFINSNVYGYQVGIYGGESSGHNTISGEIRESAQQGLLLEKSESNEIISLDVYKAGSHGIHLSQVENTSIVASQSHHSQADGLYLYQANETVLEITESPDIQFGGQSSNGSGLHIEDSHNVLISDGGVFSRNKKHGIFVEGGSTGIVLENPIVERNEESGIYLRESNGIEIYGAIVDPKQFWIVKNNVGAGIVIENAQNVHIGVPDALSGKISNISGNGQQGILITGEHTDDVAIVAVDSIDQNGAEGIRVENGKNICIGGQTPSEGNNIDANPVGILAQGADTELSILNNNIGEDYYVSGPKDGNVIGVKLQGSIINVKIKENYITANQTKGILLTDGAHNNEISSNYIRCNGEVAYDDGGAEDAPYSVEQDDILGVHFTTQPGILSQIKFYIHDDVAEFKWMVLEWGNDKPGDTVIAEGTTTPVNTSWHTVDIGDVEVPSDFVVAMLYLNENQPKLGDDWSGSVGSPRSWRYSASSQEWSDEWSNYMVRAVVQIVPKRLTENDAIERYPAWSPDGTKIAFASDRGGSMDIWVMDADGSNPKVLTTSDTDAEIQPVWSPDGSKIAFVSNATGNLDIWIMDSDGSNPRSRSGISHNSGTSATPEKDPCWTESGVLLFSSEQEGGWEIYQMNADGENVRRLTTSLGANMQPNER